MFIRNLSRSVIGQDTGMMTDAENDRLSELNDSIEMLNAERAESRLELVNIHRLPLMKLIDDLGIYGEG